MISQSRVTILVKASPQPSKRHSETVCCAGLDSTGKWKRLYPIRFRQLADEQTFKRWSVVDFRYSRPTSDTRVESCRVHEESIKVVDFVRSESKKANLVNPAVLASETEAMDKGQSLALIRPSSVSLTYRKLSTSEIENARRAFEAQARQASMFDAKLDVLEPCPYEFKLKFDDGDGKHREKRCSDWETSAAFFNLSKRYSEPDVLFHLEKTYSEDYVRKGLILGLGNIAARPTQWQLLAIFPVPETGQSSLQL